MHFRQGKCISFKLPRAASYTLYMWTIYRTWWCLWQKLESQDLGPVFLFSASLFVKHLLCIPGEL